MSDTQDDAIVELRWGVIGLGDFALKWITDVFTNYKNDTENGKFVKHSLTAVVSTTSIEKANEFVDSLPQEIVDHEVRKYSNVNDFFNDDKTNVIYIAAPNSFHYKLALQALKCGKNVLVEKTFTINHKQAINLKKLAFEKKLFILDGVWTRFLPTTKAIQSLVLEEKKIGDIHRVSADLSHNCPFNESNRLYNPKLGAGVLYDNLIYSITWPDLLLSSQSQQDPLVRSWSILSKEVPGIDISTGITLLFNDLNAVGNATGSFEIESPKDGVLIEGKKGYIRVEGVSKPSKAFFHTKQNSHVELLELPHIEGIGYYYEANIAARLLRDSHLEPKEYPLDRSISILKIFDEVKALNGIKFPTEIEEI